MNGHLRKLADIEGIKLLRTYAKEVRQLKLHTRFAFHPRNSRKAKRGDRRLQTIAGASAASNLDPNSVVISDIFYGHSFANGVSPGKAATRSCTKGSLV